MNLSRLFTQLVNENSFKIFRDIFELSQSDNRNFVETTKTQVLEGTSKWSAKVAIRGLSSTIRFFVVKMCVK